MFDVNDDANGGFRRIEILTEPRWARQDDPYPPEFRRQMVDLVHAGRSPEELAGEFEPTAQVDQELGLPVSG